MQGMKKPVSVLLCVFLMRATFYRTTLYDNAFWDLTQLSHFGKRGFVEMMRIP